MKKLIILFCGTLALAACGNGLEKKANEKLMVAKAAYERGDYEEAKLQIDSIKILYPKAFEARKAGQALMLDVETKAQQKTLAYLDSAFQAKTKEFNAIKDKFTLEKDAEYQQVGNYLWPTQTIEKNMHRSYLRFQVNEQGIMSMTSIYCGAGNIHHNKVKVIALWSRSRLSSSMSIRRFGLLSSLTSHRNRRGCKTNCVSKAIKY